MPLSTTPMHQGLVPSTVMKRNNHGATYLFDKIGELLGITADLKVCFPESYKQLLSIAYFLILEDRNTMLRFPKWDRIHIHPYGSCIPLQRISDLFASVSEESKNRFSIYRQKAIRKMNIGLTKLLEFPLIQRHSNKLNKASTMIMVRLRKLTWRCCLVKNRVYHFTTSNWQAI